MLAPALGVSLALLSAIVGTGPTPTSRAPEEVREAYVRLYEAGDADGLRKLWAENDDAILVTIDEDLEGSLSIWESETPDEAAMARLMGRALWGARLASEVTGRAILVDYAASFVGWDDAQRRTFRQGQAAYRRSREALQAGDAARALAEARTCRNLALPLGDWWGTAMGLSMEGLALAAAGEAESALAATARARLLYDQLGLRSSELATLRTMVGLAAALESWPRALVSVDAALELARSREDDGTLEELLEQKAAIERALGVDEQGTGDGG